MSAPFLATMKVRLVRLEQDKLAPGQRVLLGATNLGGGRIHYFPARLEQWIPSGCAAEAKNPGEWVHIEFPEEP